jgi:nucleoside-diphosphate-sugar epimerase
MEHVSPSFHDNLVASVNILIAASEIGCKRILTTGSMEEPDQLCNAYSIPRSPYAAAKWAGSMYARMFHELYQLPVVILHVFMVYGPIQKDIKKLIPYVILSLLRGKTPELASGQRLVDWIYVTDVVSGLIAAALAPSIEGKTLDLGSGELISIKHIVEKLVELVNPTIIPRFGALPERLHESARKADINQTKNLSHWKPEITLDAGLRETIKWYTTKT